MKEEPIVLKTHISICWRSIRTVLPDLVPVTAHTRTHACARARTHTGPDSSTSVWYLLGTTFEMGDGLDMPAASLKVLKRIAENVAAHPGEKKYRKLNLSKAKIEKVCTRNGGHKFTCF